MQTRRLSAFQTSLRPSLLLSAGHTAIDRYLMPAGLTAAGLLLWAHADTVRHRIITQILLCIQRGQ